MTEKSPCYVASLNATLEDLLLLSLLNFVAEYSSYRDIAENWRQGSLSDELSVLH